MRKIILIFISLPVLFVSAEFFRKDLFNFDNKHLISFAIIYLLSFLLCSLKIGLANNSLKLTEFPIQTNNNFKILVIVSVLLFSIFLLKNLRFNDIYDIATFSNNYRNSYYKGSGIYTYFIINILPFLTSFLIVKSSKLDRWIYISVVVTFVATFILGLRIFLFPIAIAFIIKYFSKKRNILNSILLVTASFLIFISFKYFIGGMIVNNTESPFHLVVKTLSRTSYSALLYQNDLVLLFEYLSEQFTLGLGGSVSDFKSYFVNQNFNHLNNHYTAFSSTDGIAIPISVILYNSLGWFSIIYLFIYLSTLIFFYERFVVSKSVVKSFLSYIFFIILLGSLIEDINFATKWMFYLCLVPIIIVVYNRR